MEPLPPLESVSERMRYLRIALGLSRVELQAELRSRRAPTASVMTIRRTEGGQRSPTVAEVVALAELAAVSACWIVEGRAPDARIEPGHEAQQVLGRLEAELLRQRQRAGAAGPQTAFERVDDRLRDLRTRGELDDAGWRYWLALREGAVLSGGYRPPPTTQGPRKTDSPGS